VKQRIVRFGSLDLQIAEELLRIDGGGVLVQPRLYDLDRAVVWSGPAKATSRHQFGEVLQRESSNLALIKAVGLLGLPTPSETILKLVTSTRDIAVFDI
jgi:hypothetical protein